MKNIMSGKNKTYLVILILLITALNSPAQNVFMLVYKSGAIIFKKQVAEIDSVKFHETGTLPTALKETMFVYRNGAITFQKYTADIDSFTFSKTTQISPLLVAGSLTPLTVQGCSASEAPSAVTTVTDLEQLPGTVTVNEGCSGKDNLSVSSEDKLEGVCTVTITRTYTIKDDCNESVQVVQSIIIQPEAKTVENAVFIPCGSFTMGSPATEVKWPDDEIKNDERQHEVTLSAFYMSKYEVKNSEFVKFLNDKQIGANGIYQGKALLNYTASWFEPWGVHYVGGKWIPWAGYENHPVVFETWFGADEYAKYVGGRLPTEAEWEYACRAGTTTPFNTGNCLTDLQANYDYRYPYDSCQESRFERYITQNVGSYVPNPWGLYNIHGNVGEWCSDWYGSYPENAEIDPTGNATGSKRVIRGGGNSNVAHRLRSAYRGCNYPEYGSSTTGFRVVFPTPPVD